MRERLAVPPCEWWKRDMNWNRLRGDSAPSPPAPAPAPGLGGPDDPSALFGLEVLEGLVAPDRPGMLSVGESAGEGVKEMVGGGSAMCICTCGCECECE